MMGCLFNARGLNKKNSAWLEGSPQQAQCGHTPVNTAWGYKVDCVCVFCARWGSLGSSSWKQMGSSPAPAPSLVPKVRVLALINPLAHVAFSNSHPEQPTPTLVNTSFSICMYAAWGAASNAVILSPILRPESINTPSTVSYHTIIKDGCNLTALTL